MLRYLLGGAGVLLLVVLAVFYIVPDKPDPRYGILRELAVQAERLCLSHTNETRSAAVKAELAATAGSVSGRAGAEQARKSQVGAALTLPDTIQKTEDAEIRACMTPWGEKIRDLAMALATPQRK